MPNPTPAPRSGKFATGIIQIAIGLALLALALDDGNSMATFAAVCGGICLVTGIVRAVGAVRSR